MQSASNGHTVGLDRRPSRTRASKHVNVNGDHALTALKMHNSFSMKKDDDSDNLAKDAKELIQLRFLEGRILWLQKIITIFALAGLVIAVVVNETCTVLPLERACDTAYIHFLKTACLITTIATVVFMLWQISVTSQRNATKVSLATRHAKLKARSDGPTTSPDAAAPPAGAPGPAAAAEPLLSASAVRSLARLAPAAANVALNCIHTVPGLSFKITIDMMGMPIVYRVEALLTMAMLVRTLHVATLRKYQVLSQYLSLEDTIVVRNTHTIRLFNDPSIGFSALAMKLALARRPLHFITTFFLILIFVATYIVRAAETPARSGPEQSQFNYIWNQLWITMVGITGAVGWGDMLPVTHFGRFAVIACMYIGPLLISLLTAIFFRSLDFDEHQMRLVTALDSDRLRSKVLVATARLIQFWWRTLPRRDTDIDTILYGPPIPNAG